MRRRRSSEGQLPAPTTARSQRPAGISGESASVSPRPMDYKCHLKKHNGDSSSWNWSRISPADLDLTSLSYKILIFVCLMVDAGHALSLPGGRAAAGRRAWSPNSLAVHAGTPLLPCSSTENSNEVPGPLGQRYHWLCQGAWRNGQHS